MIVWGASANGVIVLAAPDAELSCRRLLHLWSGHVTFVRVDSADGVVVLAAPDAIHELPRRRSRLTLAPLDDSLSVQGPDAKVLGHNEPPDFFLRLCHRDAECGSQVGWEMSPI
jgi:hypothetical protein